MEFMNKLFIDFRNDLFMNLMNGLFMDSMNDLFHQWFIHYFPEWFIGEINHCSWSIVHGVLFMDFMNKISEVDYSWIS